MNPTFKTLATAGAAAIACMTLSSSAHAQAFSFGYAGPGGSVGVNVGNYGYFGGGGYYGGGYYGGYPVVGPGAYIAGPVAPVYVARAFMLVGRPFLPGPTPSGGRLEPTGPILAIIVAAAGEIAQSVVRRPWPGGIWPHNWQRQRTTY